MSSAEKPQAVLLSPDTFSEAVILRAESTGETILESLTVVCEEYDIDETRVRKMITPPLLSRLTAECESARLLKEITKSRKLI